MENDNEKDIINEIIESNEEFISNKINLNKPIDYNQQKLYEENHWFYKYRIDVLTKLLNIHLSNYKNQNYNILDIGIGTGTISKQIEQYGHCIHIENDKNIINMNQDLTNIVFADFPWDLFNMKDFKNIKFDYIILFNILEYCENFNWIFEILRNMLTPNGYILITTFSNNQKNLNETIYNFKKFSINDFKELCLLNNLKILDYTYFQKFPIDKNIKLTLNKLANQESLYLSMIEKDNDYLYNYFKSNELPNIGLKQLLKGEQLFIKLGFNKDKNVEIKNNINIIDRIIDEIASKRQNNK